MLTQSLTARQQPNQIKVVKSGGATAMDLTYGYDARRLITSVTDAVTSANTRGYTYDVNSRVLTASGPWGSTGGYTYDALDNLRVTVLGGCTTTTSYDATANRVGSVGFAGTGCGSARTYTYDANGNTSGDTLRTYTHDAADQPTSVTQGSSSATFTYDGNLKRVKAVEGSNTVYTLYSHASSLVYRADATAGTHTIYLGVGPAELRLLGTTPTYTHLDSQGSAVAATDATGAVLWTEQYTPFGDTILNPTGNQNNKGFTGYLRDTTFGLSYAQARYYDPVIGRFLEADPERESDQISLYAYVGNNPINKTDPTGEGGECSQSNDIACTSVPVSTQDNLQRTLSGGIKMLKEAVLAPVRALQESADTGKITPLNAIILAGATSLPLGFAGAGADAAIADIASSLSEDASGGTVVTSGQTLTVETTTHGAARIAGPSATRGGVLSKEGVLATRGSGQPLTQADGAKVFVAESSPGKFNVVVQNPQSGKVITTFANLSQKKLDRLSSNYGWQ